jgi:hypothetical protein
MPASHTGRRTSRNIDEERNPSASMLRAPIRWHTDDAAVQKLAAMASGTAHST